MSPMRVSMRSQQSRDVETGGDNSWVKFLGHSASLEACGALCVAYENASATRTYVKRTQGWPRFFASWPNILAGNPY
jgi:hypothetical protein